MDLFIDNKSGAPIYDQIYTSLFVGCVRCV